MSKMIERLADRPQDDKRERLAHLLLERLQERPRSFPVSFAQQRLWFLDQLEGGNTIAYNIPVGLRLEGRLDEEIVRLCFAEIMRRHDSLRTTFEISQATGDTEQVIHASMPLDLELVDLTDIPEEQRLERARHLGDLDAQRPFNLSTGPLMRVCVLKLSDEERILILTIHHIVSDGWSVGVIIKELIALYEAFLEGKKSPLTELPIQYADFAHWQRNRLKGEFLENQLAYWRKQLAGRLPVLELPARGPRPARHTLDGAVRVWKLPRDVAEAAKSLGQQEGVTLFMTLLAVFKVLLYRYTGMEDLLVGTPIANRNRTEVEGLIGLFINTLVLRSDLSGDPTFREVLKGIKDAALGAYANQDVPFEKLVIELQPDRDLSRTPIFQVMFVMQNAPMPILRMADVTMTPIAIQGAISKFDLTLSIMEEADGNLAGWLEYNTNLFDEPMIKRLIGHYNTLLSSAIENPDARISRMPILTNVERDQLILGFNETVADYELDSCLHELFEIQARRTPGSIALLYEGQKISYEELDRRADRLASHLTQFGVEPGAFAGILMERSVEMVVAILGILKAGGAYVPLDPTYPKERLDFMAEDAGIRVVLTQTHLLDDLPARKVPSICLDTDDWEATLKAGSGPDPENLHRRSSPQDLAYLIYTSGSTGRPKGVMTPHVAATNMIQWMQSAYEMTPADRLIQKTAFSFDASAWEFFWPLATGATLIIARPYAERDGTYMVKTIAEQSVTILQLVPSLLKMLVEQDGLERCSSLRHVFSGGEALPGTVCKRFFERLPQTRLTNVYGPTETTMHVTVWECQKNGAEGVMPIGRPVGNTQAYVLDQHMQPVPIGVPGELCIGGVQVAKGYLNRAELTADRFVFDPFGRQEGSKLYRTGDLTRFREDGRIEFLGRLDHQVKIRGYRIELGEIESVLRHHDAVSEVVVMAREDVPGDRRLVAYIVAKAHREVKISELRHHLMAQLPDYMIPSAFVVLESLPLFSNGKVNRNALFPPDYSEQAIEEEYVAPRNDVEQALSNIFAGVLGINRVGIEANFFLLGGHSLSATQVITRIRDVLHAEVPLRRMFETPTVSGLALAVEEYRGQPEEDRIEPVSREADEEAESMSELLGKLTREELQALLLNVTGKKK